MEPNSIEQRLTELEIKVSFQEDLLDQLDAVVVRQQGQIDALIRQIVSLRHQQGTESSESTARHSRDELPPHY